MKKPKGNYVSQVKSLNQAIRSLNTLKKSLEQMAKHEASRGIPRILNVQGLYHCSCCSGYFGDKEKNIEAAFYCKYCGIKFGKDTKSSATK